MNSSKRIQQIFSNTDTDKDAIIIKNGVDPFIDPNFFYATGLTQGLFEGCSLILFPDGSSHMIVNTLEEPIAQDSDAHLHIYQTLNEMKSILSDLLNSASCIGIHAQGLMYSDYFWISTMFKEKKITDITSAFHKTRMIKDNDEIHAIQKACEIADKIADNIGNYVTHHMTEHELAAEIDYQLQRHGAQYPAFTTIASFGSNTAIPHHTHDDTRLQKGDFILCDFGANFKKYNSDMTRTFVYGSATDKQKKIHQTVQQAQQNALKLLKSGIPAKQVHNTVKTYIDSTPFKNRFIHSTGHSLGLSVHDPGIGFYDSCETLLEEQMVLTVEPGIYLPGFGGVRIEDDVLITPNGYQSLTHTSKELREI